VTPLRPPFKAESEKEQWGTVSAGVACWLVST
jgi:hypothetical protein